MAAHTYDFFTRFARILNSGQARALVLSGNVYDLFDNGREYVPLLPLLCEKSQTQGLFRVVYELNGPVRILDDPPRIKKAWVSWKAGMDADTLLLRGLAAKGKSQFDDLAGQFDQLLLEAIGNPTLALELLRQLTICSRASELGGSLLIFIEAADMLLPAGQGDVASLNDRQLHRVGIVQDWFSDPAFLGGGDSVCMIAESRSLIHPRISRLPQILSVDIPSPSTEERLRYAEGFLATAKEKPALWGTTRDLASFTAGLSIHAMRQLLLAAAYAEKPLEAADVVDKVEEFIQGQLGEDVVEFKKPTHTLSAVVGFSRLKEFLRRELLPRLKAPPDVALSARRWPDQSGEEKPSFSKPSPRNWTCPCLCSRTSAASGSARPT